MKEKIENFILLTGPDDFRRTTRQRFFLDGFRQKHPEGEITRFEKGHTFSELQNTVLTPNLFASRRLIVTESFWSPDNHEAAEKAGFWEALEQQKESVTLVCIEASLDKRTKSAKNLLEISKVENYDCLEGSQLLQWLLETATKHGAQLSRANAQYLIERCGAEAWNLQSEIKKLALASEDKNIDRALINQLTIPHPAAVVWDFLNALSKQQTALALQTFKRLLASGEAVHGIFALIMREIRIHAQLKALVAQNLDTQKIISLSKLGSYTVNKNLPLSKKFTQKQVETMYEQLILLDRRLKTGGLRISTDDTSELEIGIERFIITSTQ